MSRNLFSLRVLAGPLLGLALLTLASTTVFAHARYARSEPPAGGMVDSAPFVLKTWFTQELMSQSTIAVFDENGVQVDLGDGRVDLDDPDRKLMLVSLPALPVGVYTVWWQSLSAEDGDADSGSFTIGVGVTPPTAACPVHSTSSSRGEL